MEFQSLNYTDLCAVVALLVGTNLFVLIILFYLTKTFFDDKARTLKYIDDLFEETRRLNKLRDLDKSLKDTIKDQITLGESIASVCNEVEKLKDATIKPFFNNGDRVISYDGIKGIILSTHKSGNVFSYRIKTRKYFNHDSKIYEINEFNLKKA